MSFWIISIVVAALVAGSLALGLARSRRHRGAAAQDIQVYKDQLAEVDRDLARGVIGAEEAERSRIEVSRRLLDADRAARIARPTARTGSNPLFAAGLGLVVFAAAFGLYMTLGAPLYADLPLQTRLANAERFRAERIDQATAEAQLGAVQIDPNADPEHLELVTKLRAALKKRPDDLAGFRLLARNEAALGDFVAARKAQARVLELKGAEADAEDFATHAYLQIAATGGYVSPQAERALAEAMRRDPGSRLARFYTGVMFDQAGRPDLTYRYWQPLLEDPPADDPFAPAVDASIAEIAAAAGIRYQPSDTARPGPSAADMEAASTMSPQERQQMIRGMVDGLSDRLADEGGPPEDWARLITALGVLGETDRARAIWQNAQQVFAAAPDALRQVRNAASQAGVVE